MSADKPAGSTPLARKLAVLAYLLLVILQPLWHYLLPQPYGHQNPWLAVGMLIPLLIPIRGICASRDRAMIWGGYLVLAYFIFSIMEWWTVPSQWLAALFQLLLCCLYLVSLGVATRKRRSD